MFLVLFAIFFAVLHLPFFRKKALWDSFGERVAWALALPLLLTGVLHLTAPAEFETAVPDWIPDWLPGRESLVKGGGIGLLVGGLGLISKKGRKFASYGVMAMLASFMPANVNILQEGYELSNGDPIIPAGHWLGWANMVGQAAPIAIAWLVGRPKKD